MGRHMGRDFAVQVQLPVHALGNGLDHQVAARQQRQVLLVIGLADQRRVFRHTQGRGLELLQPFDRAADDAVFGALFGRQVKQDDRHPDIDQVRRNLCAHHAGAQHRDSSDIDMRHGEFCAGLLHAHPGLGAAQQGGTNVAAHFEFFAALNRR